MKPYFSINVQTEKISREKDLEDLKVFSISVVFDDGKTENIDDLPQTTIRVSYGDKIDSNYLKEHENLVSAINAYTSRYYPTYKFMENGKVSLNFIPSKDVKEDLKNFFTSVIEEYDLKDSGLTLAGSSIDSFVVPVLKGNSFLDRRMVLNEKRELFSHSSIEVSCLRYDKDKERFNTYEELLSLYCGFELNESLNGHERFSEENMRKRYNSLENAKNIVRIVRSVTGR